jgi:EmrB/QacA subfamily drug resistance transporter
MGEELHLSFEGTLWVQAAYLLTMAVLLIPLGRLADQRGRLKFYLIGTALFMLGSAVVAMAQGTASIIAARVVQGSGGALLSSTSTALVTAAFPSYERGRAMGIITMAVYAGLSLGPPLGGFMIDSLSWHWIFLINIPIGAIVLLWGRRLRKAITEVRSDQGIDLPGSILLGLGLTALLLPLTLHVKWGWASPASLTSFAISIVSFAAFFVREKIASEPLVDLKMLRGNPPFAFGNLATLLNYMAIAAIGILTSVWLQLAKGFTPIEAGWIMLSQPVVQSALSPITGRLSDHIDARALTTFGMAMTVLGMVLLACLGKDAGFASIIIVLAVVGIGMASFSAPNSGAVMGSVGRNQLGLAAAFLGAMRSMGMTIGVAILGGMAAAHLGDGGWQDMLNRSGGTGEGADAFIRGYRAAMLTGAGLAFLGIFACLPAKKAAKGQLTIDN